MHIERNSLTFHSDSPDILKAQILHWLNQFEVCAFLDNHAYPSKLSSAEWLIAAGTKRSWSSNSHTVEQLNELSSLGDWIFGHIAYDAKELIGFSSKEQLNQIDFALFNFFQPIIVIERKENTIQIHSLGIDPSQVWEEIKQTQPSTETDHSTLTSIQPRINKEEYIDELNKVIAHIQRGDCYELNYCQEFFAEQTKIEPTQVYSRLSAVSPAPFGTYYKVQNNHLLCASPERFIRKREDEIISQPIKGTFKRNLQNERLDHELKETLRASTKERSENVMVVDLVRNDLSLICERGTVQVDELFGIYSFPQVHQMISTISGKLIKDKQFGDIIAATFPMGSMTGAPKKNVVALIDKYEANNRGLYSGAVGYFHPNGNFDFNVVIRSIFYNAQKNYLSYWVGGGITIYSEPEKEYEECLLKAKAMHNVLTGF